MASRVLPVKLGATEVLVETMPVAGSELTTSKVRRTAEGVVDAFESVRETIVEIAASTAEVIEKAAERAARPEHVEVEFGLKLAADGNVVVAGVSAEATLRVKLTYDASTTAS